MSNHRDCGRLALSLVHFKNCNLTTDGERNRSVSIHSPYRLLFAILKDPDMEANVHKDALQTKVKNLLLCNKEASTINLSRFLFS